MFRTSSPLIKCQRYHYLYNGFAPQETQDELMNVPFLFDDEGTTIVHYNPIVYIPRKELNLNFD